MDSTSWIAKKNEGNLEIFVRREHGNVYKFVLYNSECGEKYPMLRSHNLCENYEYESESDDDSDDDDVSYYDSDDDYGNYFDWYDDHHERFNYQGSDGDWSP